MTDTGPESNPAHAERRMPERTLILLRHAKSDWQGRQGDLDRPLAARGLRQAPQAGERLARLVSRIDLAVVSPAARARATWELVAAELPAVPPSRIDDRVYAATGGELLDVVRALPDEAHAVVLVGHNPGFEELVARLTRMSVALPTSALAVIVWDGSWASAGQSEAALLASGRGRIRAGEDHAHEEGERGGRERALHEGDDEGANDDYGDHRLPAAYQEAEDDGRRMPAVPRPGSGWWVRIRAAGCTGSWHPSPSGAAWTGRLGTLRDGWPARAASRPARTSD
ncbi:MULTISPECIES: histidine phosphatase family protein [Cryobacterium]|nr:MULTISPECIES: histidine phosphatase family protein [Cryobacterium]